MALFKKQQQPVDIDLRDTIDLRRPAPFAFGFPTRCPECGERGYLDHIDPFKHIQFEHCPSCFARWELAEDDVAALNA